MKLGLKYYKSDDSSSDLISDYDPAPGLFTFYSEVSVIFVISSMPYQWFSELGQSIQERQH